MAFDLCQCTIRQLTDIRLSLQIPGGSAPKIHRALSGGDNRRSDCLTRDQELGLHPRAFYYIRSVEGHEYPDLQVGDEVDPRPVFIFS